MRQKGEIKWRGRYKGEAETDTRPGGEVDRGEAKRRGRDKDEAK